MTANHPAHGPASLDRLHQISEILSKAAVQSDGGNIGYAMADAVKVIDGAIAVFGAEPVAWTEKCEITNMQATGLYLRGFPDNSHGRDIALYTAPPASVVPDEVVDNIDNPYGDEDLIYEQGKIEGWNACRAAMLQRSQPVSNRDELPLDYLQGHKDGMEWAAQLAEANHPQTGDWLYDDPIELAKAIRKGPDMPESRTEIAEQDDNFYSWFGRFWIENYQQKNYTTSAKQTLGTLAEFAYRAGRDSAIQAGNSPVTPDGYILVPIVPTEDMIINGFESVPDPHFSDEKEWKEYEALSGCLKAAHRAKLCWAAMIKAAPQQEVK